MNTQNTITKEQATEIEQQHNVCVDIETMQYDNESHDAETGWMPIPEDWISTENTTIEYIATDTNTQDRNKIAWYSVGGENWGLVTHMDTNEKSLVDRDGCSVNLGDYDGEGQQILETLKKEEN